MTIDETFIILNEMLEGKLPCEVSTDPCDFEVHWKIKVSCTACGIVWYLSCDEHKEWVFQHVTLEWKHNVSSCHARASIIDIVAI